MIFSFLISPGFGRTCLVWKLFDWDWNLLYPIDSWVCSNWNYELIDLFTNLGQVFLSRGFLRGRLGFRNAEGSRVTTVQVAGNKAKLHHYNALLCIGSTHIFFNDSTCFWAKGVILSCILMVIIFRFRWQLWNIGHPQNFHAIQGEGKSVYSWVGTRNTSNGFISSDMVKSWSQWKKHFPNPLAPTTGEEETGNCEIKTLSGTELRNLTRSGVTTASCHHVKMKVLLTTLLSLVSFSLLNRRVGLNPE